MMYLLLWKLGGGRLETVPTLDTVNILDNQS